MEELLNKYLELENRFTKRLMFAIENPGAINREGMRELEVKAALYTSMAHDIAETAGILLANVSKTETYRGKEITYTETVIFAE